MGNTMQYAICISGAASGKTVALSQEWAQRIGTAIAKSGNIVTTGATIGLPYFGAQAAKKAGGMSIGFSPAASMREHLHKYRLPMDVYDFVNYTGMHYVGRDIHLVQSSDAIITVGGRFGSLHEFTTAIEAGMPCGVLLGSGGTADAIPGLMAALEPPNRKLVVFDDNPERLVKTIIGMLDEELKDVDMTVKHASWFLDKDKH